jgi:hypothetical protein
LLNNLAIQPLLSDIGNLIIAAQTTAVKARDSFISMGQEPFTAHYTEVLDQDYSVGPYSTYNNVVKGYGSKVIFTASMQRTYDARPLSAFKTFMQYYGLNLTYEALWNLLPFSFLADYVLKIGKSIRAMELDPNVDLTVLTYYESVLRESQWGMFVHHPKGYITFGGDNKINTSTPHFVSGLRNSHYDRYRAEPNYGPALPKFAKYRDKALLNTVALARCVF